VGSADFTDCLDRIEAARYEIHALELEIAALVESGNRAYEIKAHMKHGGCLAIIFRAPQLPQSWNARMASIIQHMRAPYDYIAVELADAHGGHDSHTSFPIYDKPKGFRGNVKRKTHNIPAKAVNMMEAVQPYHGGNYAHLDSLRRLDDDGKHKRIRGRVDATLIGQGWGLNPIGGSGWMPAFEMIEMLPGPFTDGQPMMYFRTDGPLELNPHFSMDIAFSGATSVPGKPVIPTLIAILSVTASIVADFEKAF
jgi:hypothetical protein